MKKTPLTIKLVIIWLIFSFFYFLSYAFSSNGLFNVHPNYYKGFAITLGIFFDIIELVSLPILVTLFLFKIKNTWKIFLFYLILTLIPLTYGLVYKLVNYSNIAEQYLSTYDIWSIYVFNPLFNLIIIFLLGWAVYKNKKYFTKSLFKKDKIGRQTK